MKTIAPLLIAMLLLSACQSGSSIGTDHDLCLAVHTALQADDPAGFVGLFLTDESIAAIAAGLSTDTPQQQEIKDELQGFDAAEITAGARAAHEQIRSQARTEGLDLAGGEYRGVVATKERFEVPNLSCRTVRYLAAYEGLNLVVRVDLLQSPGGFHVYEVRYDAYETVAVEITTPQGDPVQAVQGMDLAYEVAFDAEAANRQGAWIETVFDGKPAGMVAGTSLESPRRDEIPGRALTPGTHTLAVRIHPSGQATGYPLGKAVLSIEVP